MRPVRRALLGLTMIFPSSACLAADVAVVVSSAEERGLVMVSLCSERFDPQTCPFTGRARPAGGTATVVLYDVPPGNYAVAAFQDVDGDGRLTRTPAGLPLEPYGFSNGVGKTAPPRFAKAAFSVSGDGTVRIVLNPAPR